MTKQQQEQRNQHNQKANPKSELVDRIYQRTGTEQAIKPDVQTKKKIIKKFPFSSKISNTSNNATKVEDDLKDWKPTSIGSGKTSTSIVKDDSLNKKKQMFNNFLSSLPKPKDKTFDTQPINISNQMGPKKLHKQIFIKPTQQQLKWDAQDQFLTKNVQTYTKTSYQKTKTQNASNLDIEKKEQASSEKVQDNEQVIEKIVWLNEDKNSKNSNLADIVSKTWENQAKLIDVNYIDSDDSQGNKNKASFKSNFFSKRFK